MGFEGEISQQGDHRKSEVIILVVSQEGGVKDLEGFGSKRKAFRPWEPRGF